MPSVTEALLAPGGVLASVNNMIAGIAQSKESAARLEIEKLRMQNAAVNERARRESDKIAKQEERDYKEGQLQGKYEREDALRAQGQRIKALSNTTEVFKEDGIRADPDILNKVSKETGIGADEIKRALGDGAVTQLGTSYFNPGKMIGTSTINAALRDARYGEEAHMKKVAAWEEKRSDLQRVIDSAQDEGVKSRNRALLEEHMTSRPGEYDFEQAGSDYVRRFNLVQSAGVFGEEAARRGVPLDEFQLLSLELLAQSGDEEGYNAAIRDIRDGANEQVRKAINEAIKRSGLKPDAPQKKKPTAEMKTGPRDRTIGDPVEQPADYQQQAPRYTGRGLETTGEELYSRVPKSLRDARELTEEPGDDIGKGKKEEIKTWTSPSGPNLWDPAHMRDLSEGKYPGSVQSYLGKGK